MHTILFYDVVDDYVERRAQFRQAPGTCKASTAARRVGLSGCSGRASGWRGPGVSRRFNQCGGSLCHCRSVRHERPGQRVASPQVFVASVARL